MKQDTFGARIKSYEAPSTSRTAFKGQPIVARLDGKSFHTYTRGLARPFDERLTNLMVDTMKALMDRFHPTVGYTQSDEITLVWLSKPSDDAELMFGGRFQKFDSLLAGFASAFFAREALQWLPESSTKIPYFDCRTFVTPDLTEAYNTVLWRQADCTRNAVSMAAQSQFSHKALQGKKQAEMIKMLQTNGITFTDYPAAFRFGVFAKRVTKEVFLTQEELDLIPVHVRPTGPVKRSLVETFSLPLLEEEQPMKTLFGT
jgi:tRNA(His) 5'-end guanylyltransferase